ncbi:MAG: DUF1836 domain-containing protein [Limosilactobacillus sp.]|uniref:DUF1836 domain-containing protein n=1 Tax=Limosilactobacillus sp. TaxID=2773925 RepID=UPI002708C8BC|nr:DUF1836 domain-containing protein [Limosilactobacillus sp.]
MNTDVHKFELPRFEELPDNGLYLQQVVDYLKECLKDFPDIQISQSRITNYVKRDILDNPENKLYYRYHIAQLLFLFVAKNVLDQKHLRESLAIQDDSYTLDVAYNYFVAELSNVTQFVFGYKKQLEEVGTEHTTQKEMFRNLLMAFAYREYLSNYFEHFAEQ